MRVRKRRRKPRPKGGTTRGFPIPLAVSYQTLEHPILSGQGTSETLNISSKGLLFTSNEQFQAGQLVQVSLDWPARLENQIPLKLVAEGRIVRNANGQTAMTIDKYEFRTRRVAKTTAPAERRMRETRRHKIAPQRRSRKETRPGTAAGGKKRFRRSPVLAQRSGKNSSGVAES